jgi:6-pyruvoyltetrahydropterin/6-carboxytetrahydropterin synthase
MPAKRTKAALRAKRGSGADVAAAGPVFITRQVHFNAAHRLHNPAFGRKWNEKRFGRCTNPNWHGHNYVLEATVSGDPHPNTGYVIDFAKLKRILHRHVADRCDHRNLNEEVDFLQGVIPSTENLVIAFWRELEPHIKGGRLHRVRLYESPRHYAEYLGP